jgi:predicted ester cyclase
VWNGRDWTQAERAYAPDVVVHSSHLPEPVRGRQAFSRFHAALHDAYSALHLSVGDVIAEGGLVGARWTLTGVHTGDLFGIRPTGRRVSFLELALFRFVDGAAVEIWWLPDRTAQMSQLGLMLAGPLPAPLSAFIGLTQKVGALLKRP